MKRLFLLALALAPLACFGQATLQFDANYFQLGGNGALQTKGGTGGGGVTLTNGAANKLVKTDSNTNLTSVTGSGIAKLDGTAATAGTDYQAAGNYVTALTGDVTASGPGSAAATLASTAVTAGNYGDATHSGTFTVDAKGRLTSASSTLISGVANAANWTESGTTNSTLVGVATVGGLAVAGSGDCTVTNSLNVLKTNAVNILTATGPAQLSAGSKSAPALTLSDTGVGWYRSQASQWTFVAGNASYLSLIAGNSIRLASSMGLTWTPSDSETGGDTFLTRPSAGTLLLAGSTAGSGTLQSGTFTVTGTGQQITFGGTNSVPATTSSPAFWVEVKLTSDTNSYRLPIYK